VWEEPAVELRIVIEPGDPPAGSVARDGQAPMPFSGWMGLISAIGLARAKKITGSGDAPAAPDDYTPPRGGL